MSIPIPSNMSTMSQNGKKNKDNKDKNNGNKEKKELKPFVSICTPTFNRRPFIQTMFQCFLNQTYPKDRMEWIIVDDGTDPIEDLIEEANLPQIRYTRLTQIMSLGKKRNYMHSLCKGDFIVYMDDDDYYPPERVEHAIHMLQQNPKAMCAGSSAIFIYFKHVQKMVQFGPYGPNHATAGTFAFRKELLKSTQYDDTACLAEERAFLKEYTVPFVQLDPMKTILVFSHEHNTFDKRKLLNAANKHMQYSSLQVHDFIQGSKEAPIKQFFMQDIDQALAEYDPGKPDMKPNVIKQTGEIEQKRQAMAQQIMKQVTPISVKQSDGTSRQLNMEEVMKMIQELEARLQGMNRIVEQQRVYMESQAEYIRSLDPSYTMPEVE